MPGIDGLGMYLLSRAESIELQAPLCFHWKVIVLFASLDVDMGHQHLNDPDKI